MIKTNNLKITGITPIIALPTCARSFHCRLLTPSLSTRAASV